MSGNNRSAIAIRRLALGGLLIMLSSVTVAAQTPDGSRTAVSITYRDTPRPEGLPADFVPGDKNAVRFMTLTAIDGNEVPAALWTPKGTGPGQGTVVISVHGSGGDYSYNPVGPLSRGLSENGFSVLAIKTRQSGPKVNTDNFFDDRRDIEAAVYTARSLGYRSIVLHGQSLGNIQVMFYAASNWDSDIKAVVLTSAFGDLPWKSRTMLTQDEENYAALAELSFKAMREGKPAETLAQPMLWLGGQKAATTAQHFLTYRWQASSTAVGTYWIKRIPKPILLLRDQSDAIIADFEPYMLLASAREPGTLVPSIDFKLLPNDRPRSAAAHGFADNKQPLVDTVTAWLKSRNL